jgi:murein DD-endopeptidase MepM/ murein hydrolase activator NlpD
VFAVRTFFKVSFLLALLVSLSPLIVQAETAAHTGGKTWSVRWQPAKLVNGAPVLFQVSAPAILQSLSGTWLGHQVYFSFNQASKTWYGIAGVSLETPPGQYSLALTATSSKATPLSFERKLVVGKAKYPAVAVKVAKKFTEPDPEQVKEINQDKTIKEDAFKHFDPDRLWAGDFRPPVNASISDIFGTGRTFNGKIQSRHQGLDYAVPSGTPVSAVNRGTVLLARPLYFEGNCVVIDHGQGLLTLYMHLSEFKVKEGEEVARGQEVGLSGGTGRATGPHLHIAVRWQGTYLNPATLLTLQIP